MQQGEKKEEVPQNSTPRANWQTQMNSVGAAGKENRGGVLQTTVKLMQ